MPFPFRKGEETKQGLLSLWIRDMENDSFSLYFLFMLSQTLVHHWIKAFWIFTVSLQQTVTGLRGRASTYLQGCCISGKHTAMNLLSNSSCQNLPTPGSHHATPQVQGEASCLPEQLPDGGRGLDELAGDRRASKSLGEAQTSGLSLACLTLCPARPRTFTSRLLRRPFIPGSSEPEKE